MGRFCIAKLQLHSTPEESNTTSKAYVPLVSISWSFTFNFQLSAEITRRVWLLAMLGRGRRVGILRLGSEVSIVGEIVFRIHYTLEDENGGKMRSDCVWSPSTAHHNMVL